MIFVIGEILIDIFPNYERIGGAPFNFACHLKQLGFPVRFFSRVGQDEFGNQVIDRLKKIGFDLADLQIDPLHATGTVRVALDAEGIPCFTIREDVAYDYLNVSNITTNGSQAPAMIYFGSLLQRTEPGRRQLQALLSARGKGTLGFCDINMRPPHVTERSVAQSLRQSDLLKLNEEELAAIRAIFDGPEAGEDCLAWLMERFDISTVALTRGSRGSCLRQGDTQIDLSADRPSRIVDTVGAGDGYAAILAAGLLGGHPLSDTVRLASRFAARICAIPGAVPDDISFYDDLSPLKKGGRNDD